MNGEIKEIFDFQYPGADELQKHVYSRPDRYLCELHAPLCNTRFQV